MAKAPDPTLDELLKLMFQAHPWHGMSTYASVAGQVHAFVEIVPSDPVKYELDKQSGHLWIEIAKRYNRAEALETIEQSVLDYREKFGAPELRVDLLKRLLRE